MQLQEAGLQLARTQHSYEELQRKSEALLCEMEDSIARRSAIQIKVCAVQCLITASAQGCTADELASPEDATDVHQ